MNIARRMAEIEAFQVMDLLARAQALEAEGRSIIHLEVGEPDFETAAPILRAAQRFLDGRHVHYTAALGLPALREAISGHYRDRYGLNISPARIVVTAGASAALLLTLGVLVNPGDEWLLPDPGYPCNRHFVRMFEGRPCAMPVTAETAYQPTAAHVTSQWTKATHGVMVASPANPTGTLIAQDTLREIAEIVARRDGSLVVDEIYHGLTYGEDARSALELSDEIFVINSFSKYFGMTGWRLGWLVAPESAVRDIEKLAQNLFISPPTVAQHAALAAFLPETLELLESRRQILARRREKLMQGLTSVGFDIAVVPRGAFYVYANCARLSASSRQLAEQLLLQAGVAVTPGMDFGRHGAESHLRFAYTVDESLIEAAIQRMGVFFAGK